MQKAINMRTGSVFLCIFATTSLASAGETIFTTGPQQHEGISYYWLAEWKLEVTLPPDVAADDRFEMLFGSKGPDKRTLFYEYNDRSGSLAEVRKHPFQWIPIPLGKLEAGRKVVLFGKGCKQVGFLAGVRVTGRSSAQLKVKPIRVAGTLSDSKSSLDRYRADWSDLFGFEMNDQMRSLWNPSPQQPDWQRAERSSRYAGIALDKVQRWLREECLPCIDPKTKLYISSSIGSARYREALWNYDDAAADTYPFLFWAAYYTDYEKINGPILEVLEAEQRICNHLDRIPTAVNHKTLEKVVKSKDTTIFAASEYVKDGLMPIVEVAGKENPWFQRMRDIEDDIWKHADIDTPYGKIPTKNLEANGEQIQVLARLYCMTGDKKYLDWAHRLADYYLLPGKFVPGKLSDHGCEIIGGLGLLFAIDAKAAPEKCRQYRPHLEYMFDEILERGTNSDGIIIGSLQPTPGPHDDAHTGDGWGYDFVGFLDYDLALQSKRYSEAIRRPLTNLLKPRYERFNWDHGSRDNVADSVEGGLYLLRLFPTPAGFVWADREIATLLVDHTDPDRLWDVHKLEANTVRTVLIHTMLHTRNTIARPWQQGLQLGASPQGDGICIFMKSDKPYEGRIQFDIPRHRLWMGFEQDWPRMNAVPEWFTVEPDDEHRYAVENVDASSIQDYTGESLAAGLHVKLEANKPLRLIVRPLTP